MGDSDERPSLPSGEEAIAKNIERAEELFWVRYRARFPVDVYLGGMTKEGSQAFHRVLEKYKTDARDVIRIIMNAGSDDVGLPLAWHEDARLDQISEYPLGAAFVVRVYAPIAEALKGLRHLYELDPMGHLQVTTPDERRTIYELAQRGEELERLLDDAKKCMSRHQLSWNASGRLVLPSTGGRKPDYVRRLITEIFDYVRSVQTIHGNPKSVRDDIRTILQPMIRLEDEFIRQAIDDLLKRESST